MRGVAERATYVRYFARWLVLVAPVSALIGSAVAFFLWALEAATRTRLATPWLLWLLPAAGIVVGLAYHRWGKSSEGGNNLIVDEIHEPGGGVPGRMAPLVLLGTLATHLFGGSAGREGTAVQMGGSIASTIDRLIFSRLAGSRFGQWFQLDEDDQRQLLQAGIAAGFGAVFGTPITGAIFALEVLTIGRLTYLALVPCLLASVLADWTTRAWGIHHTLYPHLTLENLGVTHLDPMLLAKVAVAAVAFGIVSTAFAEITHLLGHGFRAAIARSWLRPAVGGLLVIALAFIVGPDYLGLGVTPNVPGGVSIVSSFSAATIPGWAWGAKLVFTAVTLASGFKGGEVTPLLFVGATLGHTLATLLHAPVALFAALGFVAVFAGATNTPLACTIMGVELFGADAAIYIAAACFLAYLFSGHSGIYVAQRIATPKGDTAVAGDSFGSRVRPIALRHLHTARRTSPSISSDVAHGAMSIPQHQTPSLTSSMSSQHSENDSSAVPSSHRPTPVTPLATYEQRHTGEHRIAHHSTHHSGHHAPHTGVHHDHAAVFPKRPVGLIRVYLSPRDRRRTAGWWARQFGRPLSVDLVVAAKEHGLPHALVLHSRFGYTDGGAIHDEHPEFGAAALTVCVELMGEVRDVEAFCEHHVDLLAGHTVLFRHAETWEIPALMREELAAEPREPASA